MRFALLQHHRPSPDPLQQQNTRCKIFFCWYERDLGMQQALLQSTLLQMRLTPTAVGVVPSGISNVLLAVDPLPQPINRNKPAVALGRSKAAWRIRVEPLSLARSWSVTSWVQAIGVCSGMQLCRACRSDLQAGAVWGWLIAA